MDKQKREPAKRLTPAAISKVKGGDKRQEMPDAACPGLYFLVQPSGAKSWACRARVDGRLLKFTLGKYLAGDNMARAGVELTKARAEAAEMIRQAKGGADPRQAKAEAEAAKKRAADEKAKESFEAIVRAFVKHQRTTKKSNGTLRRQWRETARTLGLVTGEGDRDDIDAFVAKPDGLVERWGNRHIGAITKKEISAALKETVAAGHPVAANRRLAALRTMFNWCVGEDVLTASPCAGINPPSGGETSRDRVLDDNELRLLLKACAKLGGISGDLPKLLLYTGQRRNECAQMRWREVKDDIWTIPAARAKNDNPHLVPLNAGAQAILAGRPRIAGPGYAFTIGGGSAFDGFDKLKKKIDATMAELAGEDAEPIPHWTLHDLRRTVATGMQRLGVRIEVTEKLLNHKSGTLKGIVAVYQHHDYAAEKRHAADAWGALLDGLLKDAPADNVVPMQRVG